MQVTLTGPVNREQLFKIQEVLRHLSQYTDKIPPNEWPATGEYTKSLNKFCPKKVEVIEATIDEVVGFGLFMKKSDAGVAEAIDIYKALGDDIPYGLEDQSTESPQQDWLLYSHPKFSTKRNRLHYNSTGQENRYDFPSRYS